MLRLLTPHAQIPNVYLGTHYITNQRDTPTGRQGDTFRLVGLTPNPHTDIYIDTRVYTRRSTMEFYLTHLTQTPRDATRQQVVANNTHLVHSAEEYLEATQPYGIAAK